MKKIFLFASTAALLLGGCSKDLTDDVVAPSISGNSRIVASYEDEAGSTRSHLDESLHAGWDAGDALGVFAAQTGDKTNAYFGYDGTAFVGDLKTVKGTEFFAYYPYSQGKSIADDGTLSLSIPDVQYYSHAHAEGFGSYAAGIVPAVGYKALAEDEDKATANVEMTMSPLVSYVGIPFKGIGKISKMTLQIKKGTAAQNIAGTIKVDLFTEDETEETFFTIPAVSSGKKTVTLDCGDGVVLNQNEEKWFVFVIPANVNLGTKFSFAFTVYGEEDTDDTAATFTHEVTTADAYSTGRNKYIRLRNNNPFVWIEAGQYLIENEQQFVEYAYVASNGVTDAPADMLNNGTLKKALVAADLDFEDFVPEENEDDAFKTAVAEWYTENEGITTIGGQAAYGLVGSVGEENAPAVISNLKVSGNGLFAANDGNLASTTIQNLTFDGLTVTPAEEVEEAYLLADDTYFFDFEDVTIKNATLVGEGEKAYFGVMETNQLEEGLTLEGDYLYAHLLKVYEGESVEAGTVRELDSKYFGEEGEALFGSIVGQGQGVIVKVANAEEAKAFIEKIDMEGTTGNQYALNSWFSVMDATTSYWTGFVGEDNNDKTLTAEELAYAVANHVYKTTLTNNLNLMGDAGKMWPVTGVKTNYQIAGNNKTISNVLVSKAVKDVAANEYYALFGTNVNVTNLTVTDLTIKLPRVFTKAYVAGIAYQSTAAAANTGIKVDGLTFDIPEGTKYADGVVGGLFALSTNKGHLAANNSVANVEAPADVVYGDVYGAISIELGAGEVVIPGNTVENAPIGEIRCSAGADLKTNQSTDFTIGYASTEVPFSIFKFISTAEKPIENGHSLWITWTDKSTTEKYVKSEQVVDDFTLGEALKEAAQNATAENPVTVSVKAGNYSSKTLTDLAEGVILDCAEGTVFEGVTAANIKGATIKGAAFEGPAKQIEGSKNDWGSAALSGAINGKFVDCTFKGYNAARGCYATGKVEFENCTFEATGYVDDKSANGGYAFHIDSNTQPVKFTDCTFKGRAAFGAAFTLTMTECKFVGNGKYNTLEMWGAANLNKCEFTKGNASVLETIVNNAATDKKIVFNGCTVNGVALVYTDVDGFNTSNCTIK